MMVTFLVQKASIPCHSVNSTFHCIKLLITYQWCFVASSTILLLRKFCVTRLSDCCVLLPERLHRCGALQAAKRATIHGLIETLESQNPLAQPTAHLERVAGDWRLLYTTITITGKGRQTWCLPHS